MELVCLKRLDRVREGVETSKELYHQMLGLGKDWEVSSVNLNLESKEVVLEVSHLTSKGFCTECDGYCKVYDYSPERRWRHLDTMQFSTVLVAKPPRVNCPKCGVKTAFLPWATKHSQFTLLFEAFAIEVLQVSKSIKDASGLLGLNWHQTQTIMKRAVERGLIRRQEGEITWLGMDEKSFRKGHDYISVLNDLDQGRVIEVTEGRSSEVAETLLTQGLSKKQREMVCGVSIDMSAPYIKAIRTHLKNADIVHDKFHIMQHVTNAVDLTRRRENKELLKAGDDTLKGTKYDWLRNKAGLREEELQMIKDLSSRQLEVTKAWHLKEMFGSFWKQHNAQDALKFFAYWVLEVKESRNKAMWKVVKMLWRHMKNILTYFDCFITNAVSEGLNSKIQSIKAMARGFRSFDNYRTTILFYCGKLKLAP